MFDIERNKSGVQEWAEKSENIQRGCPNNCLYCYSAYTFNRFKLRKREEWGREELTKRADMRSYPVCEGVVMFPSSHDITDFNVEHFIRAARLMLEKGNRLLIVSKPRRECMAKVMDALEPWKAQIQFRFTIGAVDNRLTSFWEPGAPSPLERLLALADAEKRGFARSISIEPMLGGVEETLRVVEKVSLFLPQSIWAGKMNHIRLRVARRTPEVMDAIRKVDSQQSDSEILRLHDALKGIVTMVKSFQKGLAK